jgi:hypothetical protein
VALRTRVVISVSGQIKQTHTENPKPRLPGVVGEVFAYAGKQSNVPPADEMASLEKQTSNALIEAEFSQTKIPTRSAFPLHIFVDAL